jgi:CheY-like chemotaxis protein
VYLPRAATVEADAADAEQQALTVASGGGMVLVVDDDPDVREVAAIVLREAGYAVREAGSGPDALDLLAKGRVSLALVDYAMPMMSGVEFARAARGIQPDLPIVYVTGAADTLGEDGQMTDDPVVMKPYSRASLLKIVRELALRL